MQKQRAAERPIMKQEMAPGELTNSVEHSGILSNSKKGAEQLCPCNLPSLGDAMVARGFKAIAQDQALLDASRMNSGRATCDVSSISRDTPKAIRLYTRPNTDFHREIIVVPKERLELSRP